MKAKKVKIPDDETLARDYNVKFWGDRPPDEAVRDYCDMFDKKAKDSGSRHCIQEFGPWYHFHYAKYNPLPFTQEELGAFLCGETETLGGKPIAKKGRK